LGLLRKRGPGMLVHGTLTNNEGFALFNGRPEAKFRRSTKRKAGKSVLFDTLA